MQTVRLTLVAHGMTEAMSAGRFPDDEPLSDLGRRQVAPNASGHAADAVVCGPERRCLQSAECLGVQPQIASALADLDCGLWRGLALEALPADQLSEWLTDPGVAPHGGESIDLLIGRVGHWMGSLTGRPRRILAVTSPAVIRAAIIASLQAPPISFWRIDIEPGSVTTLHWRGAWTLRL